MSIDKIKLAMGVAIIVLVGLCVYLYLQKPETPYTPPPIDNTELDSIKREMDTIKVFVKNYTKFNIEPIRIVVDSFYAIKPITDDDELLQSLNRISGKN